MREVIARGVCVFTVGVVIAVSLLFASAHNPSVQSSTTDTAHVSNVVSTAAAAGTNSNTVDQAAAGRPPIFTDEIERGRVVYAEQKCVTCHSIAVEGNPRDPLDAVASRWEEAELREWITGTGMAAEVLSAAIVKRRRRYQAISSENKSALVRYLAALASSK